MTFLQQRVYYLSNMARRMACTNKLYKPLIYQDFFSALVNRLGFFYALKYVL